jgi:uncharacterized protein (TIRG00374 family)
VKKLLYNITPSEYKVKLKDNISTLFIQIKSVRLKELIKPAIITSLWWIFFILTNYILAIAIGLKIPILILAFCLCLNGVLSFLPISFSGIGTRDAVLIMFFSQYGASYENILAYSIMILFSRIIITGLYACIAQFFISKYDHRKKNKRTVYSTGS